MKRMVTGRRLIVGSSAVVALALAAYVAIAAYLNPSIRDPFDRDASGLSEATPSQVVELKDGDAFEMRASMVRKQIGAASVKMLAYNGSVPGPVVRQLDLPVLIFRHADSPPPLVDLPWSLEGGDHEDRQRGTAHET